MPMPFDLQRLQVIRAQGRSPGLPVILSDVGERFRENLLTVGAIVISIGPHASEWDWSPVWGLSILIVPRSTVSRWIWPLVESVRSARPRTLEVYDFAAPMGERISATLFV